MASPSMPARPNPAALRPYLDQLEALPFVKGVRVLGVEVEGSKGAYADARLRIRTSAGSHDLWADVKSSHLGRGIVGQMT